LIYPYPEEKKYMKEYIDLKPSISTFRDENQSLKEILEKYKESYHDLKGRKNLCF
jgi:cell shape-determining protein MreC